MVTEAHKRAKAKYDKKTTQFYFRLRNDQDADIIAKLVAMENKTEYIRKLIAKDIHGA